MSPPSGHAVTILGMHRSGTSAAARVLNLLGLELGPHLMPGHAANERGFWEHEQLVEMNERLLFAIHSGWHDTAWRYPGWEQDPELAPTLKEIGAILQRDFSGMPLWGIKDPRLCRLLPVWLPLLGQIANRVSHVLVLRHPSEVASSLARRDGFSLEKGLLLWLVHLLDAEAATRDAPRAVLRYDGLLADWRSETGRIAEQMGLRWPVATAEAASGIEAFLTEGLRHHRADCEPAERELDATARELFHMLSARDGIDTRGVDHIADALRDRFALYHPFAHLQAQKLVAFKRHGAALEDLLQRATSGNGQ